MSQDTNLLPSHDYYAARAIEERRLAMASKEKRAREIHLELAAKYTELSRMHATQAAIPSEEQQRVG